MVFPDIFGQEIQLLFQVQCQSPHIDCASSLCQTLGTQMRKTQFLPLGGEGGCVQWSLHRSPTVQWAGAGAQPLSSLLVHGGNNFPNAVNPT